MELLFHNANDQAIAQRGSDGYINATAMCKAAGKRWDNYYRLDSTQEYLQALSEDLKLEILERNPLPHNPVKALIQIFQGGNSLQRTQVHPEVGKHLTGYLEKTVKKKDLSEKAVTLKLAKKLNGQTEVITLAGVIDILTSTELIEVKNFRNWKAALGQVLVYGDYYPSHQMRIHLFGTSHYSYLELIRNHCDRFGVVLTWEL